MGGKDKKAALDTPSPASTPATSTLNSRATTPTPSTTNGSATKDEKPPPDGKTQDDSSKLRTFLSILKRFIGVTDIAAVRFSLPAQLLEPVPNLEYWHYLDRPETFVAIGDSDDELGRMLGVLRFWFSKDLKYVKGKPCKPYNSTLGEFFRCQWEVEDNLPPFKVGSAGKTESKESNKPVKVSYLTEQTSHHPPVSAFYVECPDKGISARGFDQLSAKFTGTSIRVVPGQYNEGIFINLSQRGDEEYQLTHPAAYLGGFLRGNLYVTVSDTCAISCPKTGLRVILHYLEEGYFGKVQNKLEGVIYKSSDPKTDKTVKIKEVPEKDIVGRIEGVWTDKVYFTPGSTESRKVPDKDRLLLLDLNPLTPVPKRCPPPEEQLPNESRRFWNDVTEAITSKQYSAATARKQEIEEKQRERAREREKEGEAWKPRFFTGVTEPKGKPELSADGIAAMEGLQSERWHLDPPAEYGAI